MNIYEVLAAGVDIIHLVVIVFWVGGFMVSSYRYPRFRQIHGISGSVLFFVQLLFSFRCPLVLLSGYLRELAHPGSASSWVYKPFIVEFLKSKFGFQVSDIVVTIITALGTGLMIITLLSIKRRQAVSQPDRI